MNYVPVDSSSLEAVGYDEGTRRLGARFRSGSEYEYDNVPESVFRGILSASSAGKYFDRFVKKAGYGHRQVR